MCDNKDNLNPAIDRLIVDNLPQTGVSLAFGYGSKIVKQSNNYDEANDMFDYILAVDNPFEWHHENYLRNPSHYSFLKYFPNKIGLIVDIQERYGAQIYYNPYVRVGNQTIKYGVIKTDHLIQDLHDWTTLYVAGRLHKPVRMIVNSSDRNKDLNSGLSFNRQFAIKAALLQLPESFKSCDFYRKITQLSYSGDLRMLFGESKNKVKDIVDAQIEKFDELYLPRLKRMDSVVHNEAKGVFIQDVSPNSIMKNLEALPKSVRIQICKMHSNTAKSIESNIILTSVSKNINVDEIVAMAIASIVRKSSLSQSLKGVLSAGILKSLKYSQRKLLKSLNSRLIG